MSYVPMMQSSGFHHKSVGGRHPQSCHKPLVDHRAVRAEQRDPAARPCFPCSSCFYVSLLRVAGCGSSGPVGRISKVLRAGLFIHCLSLFFSGMRPSMYTVEPLHVLLL